MYDEIMKASFPYEIRWARHQEWETAMRLVWRTFLKFEGDVYSECGIKKFHEFITDKNLQSAFVRGEYQVLVAIDGRRIIGVASIRDRNHLSLLFVDEHYHKRGVGRNLLEYLFRYLKEEVGERFITLKASPYAVGFYRKLGFRIVTPEQQYSGIRVTAMERFFY
ncbi:MAG: GNAT family N-acetyltransferase [Lachnospiraceae bacterium]|jgi:GNAT superfamily N-acetyltransferase|nr:GNAT family N-acetyltransferase [Lachnospiraceae bacterium]